MKISENSKPIFFSDSCFKNKTLAQNPFPSDAFWAKDKLSFLLCHFFIGKNEILAKTSISFLQIFEVKSRKCFQSEDKFLKRDFKDAWIKNMRLFPNIVFP